MTAVAGFVHEGRVFIGADSAGVAGWDLTIRADSKIFTRGELVFGFTDSFRMGQLLRYKLTVPTIAEDRSIPEWMATDFVDAVRDCLKAGGFARKENEVEGAGAFLVGLRSRLFLIGSDYQVGESLDGYDACGCGCALVKGALFATRGMAPDSRMKTALEAAEHHSAGVRGPFHVESV